MSELFEDCTCKAVLLDIKEMLAEQQQQFQDHGRHQEARITILKAKVDRKSVV